MQSLKRITITSALIMLSIAVSAQRSATYQAIYSGIPWFDASGKVVSAHGANIISDNGRYYLFGEAHTDGSNAFAGFNCYSSADLYNWKFESIALPVQADGKLGPNRVGERVKVMRCPKTGEYVMFMHVDTLTYNDQYVGYATSKSITGPYTFKGPLLFQDKPIRKWDMGTFQDGDGYGYVLLHGGDIYKLSDDYHTAAEHICESFTPGFESPAILKKGNLYYFLGSGLTSWEKNDNYYFTSATLQGPWIKQGIFCPEGTLTWNSQTTFVLQIAGKTDTTYMFMGDRWSYPKQASAATYVWQPLVISGTSLAIPKYHEAWKIDLESGKTFLAETGNKFISNTDKKQINYSGKWQSSTADVSIINSDEKGAGFTVKFSGRQIGLRGLLQPDGGYAEVEIKNNKGKTLYKTLVDAYASKQSKSSWFLTPLMTRGDYMLTLTILGEHGNWSDKKKRTFGSTNSYVSLDKIIINQ